MRSEASLELGPGLGLFAGIWGKASCHQSPTHNPWTDSQKHFPHFLCAMDTAAWARAHVWRCVTRHLLPGCHHPTRTGAQHAFIDKYSFRMEIIYMVKWRICIKIFLIKRWIIFRSSLEQPGGILAGVTQQSSPVGGSSLLSITLPALPCILCSTSYTLNLPSLACMVV